MFAWTSITARSATRGCGSSGGLAWRRGSRVRARRRTSVLAAGDPWTLVAACRRAKLPELGIRALRHTFASHLTMRGVSMRSVQELMGHQSILQTMVYSHLSPDAKRDAVRLLDGAGGRSRKRR